MELVYCSVKHMPVVNYFAFPMFRPRSIVINYADTCG